MQTHAQGYDEKLCKINRCSSREIVWREQNHAVSPYAQEIHAKRCARCNRKGADVPLAYVDEFRRNIIRQMLPLGTPMRAIIGTRREKGELYSSCIDRIGDGCLVYYIEENEEKTHCLVFPEDYIQGNSSCENEPIDIWTMSRNLIVCQDLPIREIRNQNTLENARDAPSAAPPAQLGSNATTHCRRDSRAPVRAMAFSRGPCVYPPVTGGRF